MKKIVIFVIMMFVSLNVQALTGSVSINCSDSIEINATKNCTITGNTDGAVSAVSAKFKVEGTISMISFGVDSIWQGDGEGGNIQLYTDTNKTGTFNIASFTIKGTSIGTGSISISDVVFSDAEFNDINIGNQNKSIKVTEVYVPPVYATVGSCRNISYTGKAQTLASNGKYVTYTNNSETNIGSYSVTVESNNGYTFSDGTKSKTLTCKINKGNIVVNKKDYIGQYDNTKHTFELTTIPSQEVEIYYSTKEILTSKNYTLLGSKEKPEISETGVTTIYYYIHDKSGKYNDYSSDSNKNNALITIEEQIVTKSSDATLKTLKINNEEIKLINNKYEYNIETEKEEIAIIGIANDSKATIEIPKDLKLDNKEKTYEIKVIAEDGTSLIYKVKVVKKIDNKKLLMALGSIGVVIIGTAVTIIIKSKR